MSGRLPEDALDRLIDAAAEARLRAYAPYSHFFVGAALLLQDGAIVTGANVENASYGLTICAERTAIFAAIAAGHRRFRMMAVVTAAPTLTSPCGACRQVIREFSPDLTILLASTDGRRRAVSLAELLPESFGPESLLSGD